MATIDAAIIKALVEHIGMNPDDIPTAGSSDTIDVSKYQEYPSDSFQVFSDHCVINANNFTPKVGDIMHIPNVPTIGEVIAFITRIEDDTITFIFKRDVYAETFEFKDSANNKQFIFSGITSDMGNIKFYTTGIKLNNPTFLERYFYDIERRLGIVVRYVEHQQSQ